MNQVINLPASTNVDLFTELDISKQQLESFFAIGGLGSPASEQY